MKNTILKDGLALWNQQITEQQEFDFHIYMQHLLEKNKVMNLTNITEENEIYTKHFLDSLSCLSVYPIPKNSTVIDIGTGAGFPSVPIKIMRRDLKMTLLDSLNKRINFLKEVGEVLHFEDMTYLHGRAEDLAQKAEYRQMYDFAVSRAVASLPILLESTIPFLKIGGIFICQKGPQAMQEIAQSKSALKLLGAKVEDSIPVKIGTTDLEYSILIIKKIEGTSKKYPRKAGKPSKEPL